LAAVLVGSGLGWTAWCRDWTYFWTFLLLFLFLSPKVLSSTTFCFFASSAFDGAAFFGGILPRGSDSRCREGRVGFGSGRREEEAAARGGEEGFVGLGLLVRKGMAEARRKFLETVEVTWRCEEAGLDGGREYWAAW